MSHLRFAMLLAVYACLASSCSTMRTDFVKQDTQAIAPVEDTSSARYIAAELRNHPNQSGFRLLAKSTDALMSRIALADRAEHSIDLQYYIFKNDATGRLLAQHLLAAADRGVRVRILLDDITLSHQDRMLDALDVHENIEVRLFNPYRTRSPSLLSKIGQFLLEGSRLNRRMHNKSFIVDGDVAIIGGRNIGDDYFDAGNDTHFRDLDVIAIGPVVPEASKVFDDYWNCDAAFPVKALGDAKDPKGALEHLRAALSRDTRKFEQSDYARDVLDELPDGATANRWGEWYWGTGETIADQPEKIESRKDDPELRIGPKLKAMIDGAQHEVLMTTPYFVPGKTGTAFLKSVAERGVTVKVLTNSLASTDETAAHAGYSHYRPELLAAGIDLFELRPSSGQQPVTTGGTSSGVSLHAKSVVVDGHAVFIGSLNLDQRSKSLNTEMGVIIDSPKLAEAVAHFFSSATSADSAFHVTLAKQPSGASSRLEWSWEEGGKQCEDFLDPDTTAKRRAEVALLRLLPIEGLL